MSPAEPRARWTRTDGIPTSGDPVGYEDVEGRQGGPFGVKEIGPGPGKPKDAFDFAE